MPNDKNETITVCADCGEEIRVLSAGDESWDFCEMCRQVEGPTKEVTQEEYETIHD